MGVEQKEGAIVVNQDHYLETIEVPEMEKYSDAKDLLSEKDQESFRGVVGKVGWLSNLSRPDVSFDTVVLSSKLGKATKEDMDYAIKVLKKIKMEKTRKRKGTIII